MALNDLASSISHESFVYHPMDETVEAATVKEVLELLIDKNAEVKNLAVKTYVYALTQTRHAVDPRARRKLPCDYHEPWRACARGR